MRELQASPVAAWTRQRLDIERRLQEAMANQSTSGNTGGLSQRLRTENVLWALSSVTTRAFSLGGSEPALLALVPVADMINAATFKRPANVVFESIDEGAGGVTIRAGSSGVVAGEELLLMYPGSLSSAVAAMDYGFVDEGAGANDHIVLSVTGKELLEYGVSRDALPVVESDDVERIATRLESLKIWTQPVILAARGQPPPGSHERRHAVGAS